MRRTSQCSAFRRSASRDRQYLPANGFHQFAAVPIGPGCEDLPFILTACFAKRCLSEITGDPGYLVQQAGYLLLPIFGNFVFAKRCSQRIDTMSR